MPAAFAAAAVAMGLPEPVPEFRFHPTRKWKFDWCWPDAKVAVEIEGGIWVSGRHTRGSGFEKDCEKYLEAAALGWTVLRVTPKMATSGIALTYVERVMAWRGKSIGKSPEAQQ